MSKQEDEAFAKWKEELGAKLQNPEDKELWSKFTEKELARDLYRGTIREADYYRRLNELDKSKKDLDQRDRQLKDDVERLDAWYAKESVERVQLQKERDEAMKKLSELGLDGAEPSVARRDEVEELKRTLSMVNERTPKVLADLTRVAIKSMKEGFDVDPDAIVQFSMKNRVDINRAYEVLTQEARDKKAQADVEKRIEEAKEEARREALSKIPQPGFVRPNQVASPAYQRLVEGAKPKGDVDRVSRAVAALRELESGR